MLVELKVNDFSLKIAEYQRSRVASFVNVGGRDTIGYRSHGILSSHSISSAWLCLSCFGVLALVKKKLSFKRILIIFSYSVFIIFTMNFTAIVAFFLIILFFELGLKNIFKLKVQNIKYLIVFLTLIIVSNTLFKNKFPIIDLFNKQLVYKIALLSNEKEYHGEEKSITKAFFYSSLNIFKAMLDFPIGIIIGDGFSTWGSRKGGDFGYSETINRFGIPFYLFMMFAFFLVVKKALKDLKSPIINQKQREYLVFSIYTFLYIILNELHYSIWINKSILPILFITLANYKQKNIILRSNE
tara:strand:- start:12545 stop:13441 length:897 start_codon:yes stop_codon:yes gene_type:complete